MPTSPVYTEKEILADALTAQKGATNLFNNFANECVHDCVRDTMLDILNEEHAMQVEVFNAMHEKGFYPTPAAQQEKINQVKQTHAAQLK